MKMEKENYFDIANHKFCCINGGYETMHNGKDILRIIYLILSNHVMHTIKQMYL